MSVDEPAEDENARVDEPVEDDNGRRDEPVEDDNGRRDEPVEDDNGRVDEPAEDENPRGDEPAEDENGRGDELVEEVIALQGRDLRVLRPRDAEALLDEHAFEHEEFLPYWAELWPSGVALARAVAPRALHGRHIVELGCGGLALPSIAAALAGGRVLATDWSRAAIERAAANAQRNGAAIGTLVASWTDPGAIAEHGPFALVLASDVLYERRDVAALLDALPALLALGGEAWIADPGRPPAAEFLERAAERFHVRTTQAPEIPQGGIHRLTTRT